AGVKLADLDLADDILDYPGRFFRPHLIGMHYRYPAVILDIDFHVVALINNIGNDPAAAADYVADFHRVDEETDDFRRVLTDVGPRSWDSFQHVLQNLKTGRARLGQRFAQYIFVDSGNFNVHLQGGDSR